MRQIKIRSGSETIRASLYKGRGVPLVYLQISEVDGDGLYRAAFASTLITPSQARRLASALLKFAGKAVAP